MIHKPKQYKLFQKTSQLLDMKYHTDLMTKEKNSIMKAPSVTGGKTKTKKNITKKPEK